MDSESDSHRRTYLVVVNPHSGKGLSMRVYESALLAEFEKAKKAGDTELDHELFVSKAELRIDEYLREKSLEQLKSYAGIIVVSGDGMLHDTLNALMARPDWREALAVTKFGLVPSGSGNGIAFTMYFKSMRKILEHNSDESEPGRTPANNVTLLQEATKLCCQQVVQPRIVHADLIRLSHANKESGQITQTLSFLSFGWGLLANIDVDSDWLRKIGSFRFKLYGFVRCFTGRSYLGKLSYKTVTEDTLGSQQSELVELEDRFAAVYVVYQEYISSDSRFAPSSRIDDQLMYLTYIRGSLTACDAFRFLTAIENGTHDRLPFVTVAPITEFELEPLEDSKLVVDGETLNWQFRRDGPVRATILPLAMQLLWEPSLID